MSNLGLDKSEAPGYSSGKTNLDVQESILHFVWFLYTANLVFFHVLAFCLLFFTYSIFIFYWQKFNCDIFMKYKFHHFLYNCVLNAFSLILFEEFNRWIQMNGIWILPLQLLGDQKFYNLWCILSHPLSSFSFVLFCFSLKGVWALLPWALDWFLKKLLNLSNSLLA